MGGMGMKLQKVLKKGLSILLTAAVAFTGVQFSANTGEWMVQAAEVQEEPAEEVSAEPEAAEPDTTPEASTESEIASEAPATSEVEPASTEAAPASTEAEPTSIEVVSVETESIQREVRAAAQPEAAQQDYAYNVLEDGTAEITGYRGTDQEITIPKEIVTEEGDTLRVTRIGDDAFYRQSDLRSVTIQDGVTSIGLSAFRECNNLVTVALPDTIASIETCAFYNCSALTTINIPAQLTFLGNSVFIKTSWIAEQRSLNEQKLVIVKGYLIDAKEAEGDVIIPDEVVAIDESAFYKNAKVTSITVPKVVEIGNGAFSACTNLVKITLPEGLTTIVSDMFSDCAKLCKVNIPDTVTDIEVQAFDGCRALDGIILPEGIKSLDFAAFRNCGLTEIRLPDGVESVSGDVFYGCINLASVELPENIDAVSYAAFGETPYLAGRQQERADHLVIDNGILWNAEMASGDVVIPETVTKIGDGAFGWNRQVESVKIPETVTEIGAGAFNATSITAITDMDGEEFPKTVQKIGGNAFPWGWLDGKRDEAGFVILNDILVDADVSGDVVIPDGVKAICDNAFHLDYMGRDEITSISIPDSVVEIGENAFMTDSMMMPSESMPEIICPPGSAAEEILKGMQENGVEIKVHEHMYTKETVTKESTCTEEGTRELTCESCGGVKTEAIPAKGHTPVTIAGTPATHESTGLTDGQKCSVCGAILTAQEVIPVIPAEIYAIKVNNGTAKVDGSAATACEAGKTVTITADGAPEGKQFKEWQVASGGAMLADAGSDTTTFIMPKSAVEITAVYEEKKEPTYTITEVDGNTWTVGADGSITITGNGDFEKFTGIKVDGVKVDSSNYTVKKGSTIITLKKSYLDTLSKGSHTIEIFWTDGSAFTTFTLEKAASDEGNGGNTVSDANSTTGVTTNTSKTVGNRKAGAAKTGDETPCIWLFVLMLASGTGLVVFGRKREEEV